MADNAIINANAFLYLETAAQGEKMLIDYAVEVLNAIVEKRYP